MKRFLIAAAALLLAAGCSVNSTFVYKPGTMPEAGRKLPVKLAVLPFADGTEDFTQRGGLLTPESLYYNLAKAGIGGHITALTPELWAKAFADETAASGDFRAVRFLYAASELTDEDYRIEGTVEKATVSGAWVNPSEFAIRLRAYRKSDREPVWEKAASRTWKNNPAQLYAGCGAMAVQCMVDRHHGDVNRIMRELFNDARADLVRVLAPLAPGAGGDGLPPSAASTDGNRDETIESILKGR